MRWLGPRRRRCCTAHTGSILLMALRYGERQRRNRADIEREVVAYLREVGTGLQVARLQKGLSQQQLADLAQVSVRHVGEVEAGGNTSLRTLARLCLALRVCPDGLPLAGGLLAETVRAAHEALDVIQKRHEHEMQVARARAEQRARKRAEAGESSEPERAQRRKGKGR